MTLQMNFHDEHRLPDDPGERPAYIQRPGILRYTDALLGEYSSKRIWRAILPQRESRRYPYPCRGARTRGMELEPMRRIEYLSAH